MNLKSLLAAVIAAVAVSYSTGSLAQSSSQIVSEDFTGQTSTNKWFFFQGACLTEGTGTGQPGASPGYLPSCVQVYNSYYGVADSVTGKLADPYLVGGYNGFLGVSSSPSTGVITPDPQTTQTNPDGSTSITDNGALRLTNGNVYASNGTSVISGLFERGAIVSAFTFPTGQGLQISFKTVTYLGNSGGTGTDGADGISFYLLDGCMPITGGAAVASTIPGAIPPSGCGTTTLSNNPLYGSSTFPALGATGGSLAYSCSNANKPFDGLAGAYLGLGIDEYGNFLNGTTNTLNELNSSGTTNAATSDNTASGGGYQWNRIGLRGAGNVTWQTLLNAYGNTSSGGPYYPSALTGECPYGLTLNSGGATCGTCPSGTNQDTKNSYCDSCPSGTTFAGTTCGSCLAGAAFNATSDTCSPAVYCPNGGTYSSSSKSCSNTCSAGYSFNSSATNGNACEVCTSPAVFDPTHAKNPGTAPCATCSSGSYSASTGKCSGSGRVSFGAWGSATSASVTATPTATLVNTNPTQTPNSTPVGNLWAVEQTCKTGHLWNLTAANLVNPVIGGAADAGPTTLTTDPTNPNSANTAGILDYNAFSYNVIPTTGTNGFKIATEAASTRALATPILYNLQITSDGLLSLSYSYGGGAAVQVLSGLNIIQANGALPGSFRFGFAGSTGGSNNVHEILCFKAAPAGSSGTSGSVNVYQNPTLHPNQQFFLANYYPSDWTGQLTAIGIYFDTSLGTLAANPTPLWDARCDLTGITDPTKPCSTGQTNVTAEPWANTGTSTSVAGSRVMLTWDPVGKTGEAFEWTSGITSTQKTALGVETRLDYLRGNRSDEVNSSGVGLYRTRDQVLGDIVDSSPNWVGPPQNPYTLVNQWVDMTNPLATAPENATGAQTYAQFMAAQSSTTNPHGELQRTNVVWVGGNDGFLHGFRAGSLDINGDLVTGTGAPLNDGYELLAYMPGTVLANIHASDARLDPTNTQYGHAWFVDAPPATGDVFYGNLWHTWVVGGLGPGGAAIYALDVTDPTNFSEGNAATIVQGEWTPSNLTCATSQTANPSGSPACGTFLGNTYGTPQIRRFHANGGQWGFVFGNGFGNANGGSGVYIALLATDTGRPTFYWLPTINGSGFTAATNTGIATPEAADYDLDHTVDYIYAGDLQGKLWKFDVTSSDPTAWKVTSSSPLFTAPAGQAISTQPQVSTVKTITTTQNSVGLDVSNAPQRVIINFGTGQAFPQTLTSAATYATGQQAMYGVWDWDMDAWNALETFQPNIGLPAGTGAAPITQSNLVSQTLAETFATKTTAGFAKITSSAVCWSGSSVCSTTAIGSAGTSSSGSSSSSGGSGSSSGATGTMYGWFMNLPSTDEQIIFDPFISRIDGSLNFNTYIPSSASILSCTDPGATGFSLGMDSATGNGLATSLFNVGGQNYDGVQTNAVGTGTMLNSGTLGGGKNYLITHGSCSGGNCQGLTFTQTNTYSVTTGQRVYWVQKR